MNIYKHIVRMMVVLLTTVLSLEIAVAAEPKFWQTLQPMEKTVFSPYTTWISDKRYLPIPFSLVSKEKQLQNRDACISNNKFDWMIQGPSKEIQNRPEVKILGGLNLINAIRKGLHETYGWPAECLKPVRVLLGTEDGRKYHTYSLMVTTKNGDLVLTDHPEDGAHSHKKFHIVGIFFSSSIDDAPKVDDFVPLAPVS